MENRFVESAVLGQTYQLVEQRFSRVSDLAHGWEHVQRVYQLALHIAEQEGADCFIVGMAALLHDLGRAAEHSEDEHHADLSVKLAREVMEPYHIPAEKLEAILHAIIAHSFSRGVNPLTLEACIVRDADRLDGLGALGIMRWALTGAALRTPQTLCYHPTDPFGEKHELDDRKYMLDHFFTKLLKLRETMTTRTGQTLAQQRTAFMQTYLDEFRREIDPAYAD